MSIIKRISTILLATSVASVSIQPVKANPAALAVPAICAGTAGVGCVLIGVASIGGTVYYVWQHNDGKRTHTNTQGQVILPYDRPGDSGEWDEPIAASNYEDAARQCRELAKEYSKQGGIRLIGELDARKVGRKTDFRCIFRRVR